MHTETNPNTFDQKRVHHFEKGHNSYPKIMERLLSFTNKSCKYMYLTSALELTLISIFIVSAKLARKLYEQMRREAASIRIQKHARAHAARMHYKSLQASATVIQSGLRAMAARNEYRFRRRTKAATKAQVCTSFTWVSLQKCFKVIKKSKKHQIWEIDNSNTHNWDFIKKFYTEILITFSCAFTDTMAKSPSFFCLQTAEESNYYIAMSVESQSS